MRSILQGYEVSFEVTLVWVFEWVSEGGKESATYKDATYRETRKAGDWGAGGANIDKVGFFLWNP